MYRLHRFLSHHRMYSLTLCSAFACALLALRVEMTNTRNYLFLGWNLILAWIPYLAALWAASTYARYPRQAWRLLVPGMLWLLFLPNGPYLITDFAHLPYMEFVRWFDIGLLAAFALSGWLLGVVSLRTMQEVVARICGTVASWGFVLVSAGLCGLGIYLGRFLRWNSWDVLVQPRTLLREALAIAADPAHHARIVGVSLLFAGLLLIGHLVLGPTSQRQNV
jgi:uncharacterized membrane protein